jgi:hypothetical protein
MLEVPVLLMVIETIPPPFQVDDSANEIPARQFPVLGVPVVEVVAGRVGVVAVAEVLVVEVEVELELELALALELEVELEELAAELATEAWPAVHWLVAHWQVAALLQEGEPPPPQGT